jgi:hypothetical protein
MAIEKYVSQVKSSQPQATISPRGAIIFNLGARDKYRMDEYTHAALSYDRDDKKIYVELSPNDSIEGALSLRKQKNTVEVAAQGFKKHFNLNFDKHRTYNLGCAQFETDTDYIVIDLNEKVDEQYKPPRAPRKKLDSFTTIEEVMAREG